MLEGSVLLGIAQKTNIHDVYAESINTQVVWFKNTLIKLEDFLDTGDLTQLTPSSLSVIKTDLLNIINGFRQIQAKNSTELFTLVKSMDKMLTYLRNARNIIFECDSMFEGNKLRDEKTEIFYPKMSACRADIAEALTAFL